ncbi:hypothetical protein [Staphylococcus aureus]|uniref:hypothetical protein n=1 Tax=Staphylococcus aureus TaxID=1280 RepID=UPI0015598F00|nr:hypothetical protein [Staphylococcus aureus]
MKDEIKGLKDINHFEKLTKLVDDYMTTTTMTVFKWGSQSYRQINLKHTLKREIIH